jgi:uncharacterized protein
MLSTLQYGLGGLSGTLVGFSLGLTGGGGTILAVPLMVYFVGVPNPHIAIGTSAVAVAVAANAGAGLVSQARAKTVKRHCGGIYALARVPGALIGSTAGKVADGQKLLFLFALVMVAVGILMLKQRRETGSIDVSLTRENAPKVLSYGLGTGLFSGFFGVGGGFLIVPGLIASTKMPMINAVGTSLIAVTAFGLTTALNYAFSSWIDWKLAAAFVAGGITGVFAGTKTARHFSTTGTLTGVFATVIFLIAAYVLWKSYTQM